MPSSVSSKNFASKISLIWPKSRFEFVELSRQFFGRRTLRVAKDLIGKCLVIKRHRVLITECEAYCGVGDPASHAFRGPTPRSQVMFEGPGVAYVYFIYGMYHCLNVVTEPEGQSGAVLIRGGYDLDRMQWILGPGRLCKTLGIDLTYNRKDLVTNRDFQITNIRPVLPLKIRTSPRIGISKGNHLLYRFYVEPQELEGVL